MLLSLLILACAVVAAFFAGNLLGERKQRKAVRG